MKPCSFKKEIHIVDFQIFDFNFFDCGFYFLVISMTFGFSKLFLDLGQFPVLWSDENVVSFNSSVFFTDNPIRDANTAGIWSSSRCAWRLSWLWSLCWSWGLSWFWWLNKSWFRGLGRFWDWFWNWLRGWSRDWLWSWSWNWFWSWNGRRFRSISLRHVIRIALAIATNRDHIKFCHGHHSDLRMDVDTEIFCL